MAKRVSGDRVLFITTVILVVFGLVMVFSSSAVLATYRYGNPREFFWRQLAWAVLGLVAMLILTITFQTAAQRLSVVAPPLPLP